MDWPRARGIPVAVQIAMMGRSHSQTGTQVMGPILFPVAVIEKNRTGRATTVSDPPWQVRHTDEFLAQPSPRLPSRGGVKSRAMFGSVSLFFHAAVITFLLAVAGVPSTPSPAARSDRTPLAAAERPRLVVLMEPTRLGPGGGGGGGGNRQRGPIPRAQAPGRDPVTLPIAPPIIATAQPEDVASPLQLIVLDAKPLASGLTYQVGSLDGALMLGSAQGPGSGGGVGDGVGTGIGSGRGPGVGPGSGGGTGGGVYRPGGSVTSPTLLRQVTPTYTAEALRARIQGSVVLEAVIQSDGTPRDIRVIRSLHPGGLDRQAVLAVEQWRFGPGRFNGVPVDVLVSIILDFSIR